jgi:ribosomal-protein-alanine N-acetyltransferase
MFEIPEKFETNRLILRKFHEGDEIPVYSYAFDHNVVKYMNWPRHNSMDDSIGFVNYAMKTFKSGVECALAIVLKENSLFIGSTGFQLLDDETAYLGFIIHPNYWNQGYATEAAGFLFQWLSKQPQLKNIVASCHNNNDAAKKVLKKIGIPLDYKKTDSTLFPNLTGENQEACFYKAFIR